MNLKSIFSKISVSKILLGYLQNLKRFPLSSVMSLIATTLLIYLTAITDSDSKPDIRIGNMAILSLVCLPFVVGIELFNERKRFKPWISILFLGLVLSWLIFRIISLETIIFENNHFLIEIGTLVIVFHLFVSVAPFLFVSNTLSFWQYNKSLFLGILTAFLYSVTLSLGLNLALAGIQSLFDLEISYRIYLYTFISVNLFFNTSFFLSRIPNLETLDSENSYPVGLKVFTQYVLLPLVAIYTLILLAYEIKIGISLSLPKGWVSTMVLASAVFGILAFLLLYPIKSANKWVQNFNRLFYWLLLPLVALMFVAIYFRINQYGITEFRYAVALLTVWLFGISLYFSLSKVDNIKYIPLSLLLILLFGIYAPFNAFQSSRINQLGRLKEVIEQEKLLVNGKIIITKAKKFDKVTEDKLLASLEYLVENRPETLKSYLSKDLYDKVIKGNSYNKYYILEKGIGLNSTPKDQVLNQHYFSLKSQIAIPISEYDYFKNISDRGSDFYDNFKIGNDEFKSKIKNDKVEIVINNKETLFINLDSLKQLNTDDEDLDKLSFLVESKNWKMKFVVLGGNSNNTDLYINNSYLLLSKK